MPQGATVYVFKIELADSDRSLYLPLELRVARHPSESEEHLLTRVVAYCLEYTEGIEFSKGLFDSNQPTIAIRDLTGALNVWIDVGAPEASRMHKAGKAADRVAIYSHKDTAQLATRLAAERIHRLEKLELYAIDREWLASIAARLSRRMEFTLTVADRNLYLSLGAETFSCVVEQIRVAVH